MTTRKHFAEHLDGSWQLICGYNKSRHDINRKVRAKRGFKGDLPNPGETLICLQNQKLYGVFNGMQAECLRVADDRGAVVELVLRTDDDREIMVPALAEQFGQNKVEDWRDQSVTLWDFGYCLTAHKAQGSEWPKVCVLEEVAPAWDAARWRYTVATRARERLVYCR